jgi:hypothetical protein
MKPVPKNPTYASDERILFVKGAVDTLYVDFSSTHPDELLADFTIRATLMTTRGDHLWTREEGAGIERVSTGWILHIQKADTNYKVGLYAMQIETTALAGGFQSENSVPVHIVANTTPDRP